MELGVGALPSLGDSDEVELYYLEASFPYNAPGWLVSRAGDQFTSFVTTHCGLGVFDVTTNVRFSVELVAQNYTGALLPITTATELVWNNAADLAVTNPFQPGRWLVSRLVSTTSGTAYNDLVSFLKSGSSSSNWRTPGLLFYNPVTVMRSNAGSANEVLVAPSDSYTFVQAVLQQLSNFGAPLDSFLSPGATSFTYYGASAAAVSWPDGAAAPAAVLRYYQGLQACYQRAFASAGTGPSADTNFLLALQQQCYKGGGQALVFRGPSSVWNVTLALPPAPATPALVRAPYALPTTPTPAAASLSATDGAFVILLLVLGLCGLAGIVKQTACVRKSRFHLEQDRMAEWTVGGILQRGDVGSVGGEYPHFSQADAELHSYFYPRRFRWEAWYPQNWSWWGGGGGGGGQAGAGSSSWRESSSTKQLAQRYQQQQRQQQQQQQQQRLSLNPWGEDEPGAGQGQGQYARLPASESDPAAGAMRKSASAGNVVHM